MIQTITVGPEPRLLSMRLVTGADFYETQTVEVDGVATDWPAGTTLAYRFDNGVTWAATIVGAVATFNLDKADADAIPAGTGVRLTYTNGTTDETWEIGTVKRRG